MNLVFMSTLNDQSMNIGWVHKFTRVSGPIRHYFLHPSYCLSNGPEVLTAGNHNKQHEKTDLKVFVVVISKEGWARVAAPILLLVWHWLFRIWLCWHHRLHSWKVGVMPKEGWHDKDLKVCFLVTRVNWPHRKTHFQLFSLPQCDCFHWRLGKWLDSGTYLQDLNKIKYLYSRW